MPTQVRNSPLNVVELRQAHTEFATDVFQRCCNAPQGPSQDVQKALVAAIYACWGFQAHVQPHLSAAAAAADAAAAEPAVRSAGAAGGAKDTSSGLPAWCKDFRIDALADDATWAVAKSAGEALVLAVRQLGSAVQVASGAGTEFAELYGSLTFLKVDRA